MRGKAKIAAACCIIAIIATLLVLSTARMIYTLDIPESMRLDAAYGEVSLKATNVEISHVRNGHLLARYEVHNTLTNILKKAPVAGSKQPIFFPMQSLKYMMPLQ